VPGALFVRAEYAKEHPENVAKFLAVYLRAWKWMNAHQPEAIAMMKKFYDIGGVSITEASMKKEFDTRPTYDLAGQLRIMDRSKGPSDVDKWMTQIGEFMKGTGAIAEVPQASAYITDEYIEKYPNTVQAVVNAMVRADKWIAKASPQQIVDLMPAEYKAGNPTLYKEGLLKNMIGFSENGEMSMKAAENVYKVLHQFEPSVMNAGTMNLATTFDNSFVKKANAKYP